MFGTYLCAIFLSQLVGYASGQTVCNNSPQLCGRAYNNVTVLGAHDSPFVRNATNGYSVAGDQFYSPVTQLDAGVRLLTAQVHQVTDASGAIQYRLCHTLCQLYDAGLLVDFLSSLKAWLDAHPNDVVTLLLVNSDNVAASNLDTQFTNANIKSYGYVPSETTQPMSTWPTLSQMIASDKRLVTFVASLDPTTNTVAPYLLDEFTFVFENNYDNDSPTSFSCDANRPASLNGMTAAALSSGRLPLMNHFLYDVVGNGIEIPAVEDVGNTNAASEGVGSLGAAAANCTAVYGKAPTFILVDFFNVGPAIDTVDRLNGVQGQTQGRSVVATAILPLSVTSTTAAGSAVASSISSVSSSVAASSAIIASGTSSSSAGVMASASTRPTSSGSASASASASGFASTPAAASASASTSSNVAASIAASTPASASASTYRNLAGRRFEHGRGFIWSFFAFLIVHIGVVVE